MREQLFPGISNSNTEETLQALQAQYLVAREKKYFQEMFKTLLPYARSQVLKKIKNKIFLPQELVYDYSLDACIKFLSQYDNPNFKVDSSFGGLLGLKVLESMHGPKIIRADQISSLNQHLEGDNTTTELGDLSETLGFKYMFHPESHDAYEDPAVYLFNKSDDAVQSVMTVMDDLYDSVTNPISYMRIMVGIIHFIRKSKNMDRYKKTFLDEKSKNVYEMALLEIANRLRNIA
jgi:hypothetical protein